jgi:hypothetical protein
VAAGERANAHYSPDDVALKVDTVLVDGCPGGREVGEQVHQPLDIPLRVGGRSGRHGDAVLRDVDGRLAVAAIDVDEELPEPPCGGMEPPRLGLYKKAQ